MCGVVGLFPRPGKRFDSGEAARALHVMRSRGPDAGGLFEDPDCTLGHRRLAIQDLDARSNQPMVSQTGRFVISFNGEIYNVAALRKELLASGIAPITTSDTEIILHLFERHGVEMLNRLRGMFAIVIWDRTLKRALVARDPYGIKPLFIGTTPRGIVAASQVRAILATGSVSREPDAIGRATFWMLGSVADPRTWFRDIASLPAGHYAWIEAGSMSEPRCWWNVSESWRDGSTPPVIDDRDLQAVVSEALRESVREHLVADVPVGLLLSGGIDSGAIAGFMVDCGIKEIHAVTVAFPEFSDGHADEVPGAKTTAGWTGIRHTIRPVTAEEFHRDLPEILASIDQPSVDGINTWYATKSIAEQGLKVALSGIGGDELFMGYRSFKTLPSIQRRWMHVSKVPLAMQAAGAISRLLAWQTGNSRWLYTADWFRSIPGAWWARRGLFGPDDLHALMGPELAQEALETFSPDSWIANSSGPLPDDPVLALAQIESTNYLRNQLLRDSDWASMSHSVELRTPFVDAWLLRSLSPFLALFKRFPGKSLLSNAPIRPLPDAVSARTKTGFGIPLTRWLSSSTLPLKERSARGWGRYLAQHLYEP